jgi:hypothetical protein
MASQYRTSPGSAFSGRTERTASKIGGGLLFALAAYIITGAVWSLWMRHGGVLDSGADRRAASDADQDPAGATQDRNCDAAGQPGDAGGCRREHHLRLAVAGRRGRPDCRFDARRVAREAWSGKVCCDRDSWTVGHSSRRSRKISSSARAPTDRPEYLLAGTIASAPTCHVSAT